MRALRFSEFGDPGVLRVEDTQTWSRRRRRRLSASKRHRSTRPT